MTWTEIINIKAYSSLEAQKIIKFFYDLTLVENEKMPTDISLLKNYHVNNDFYIRLTWHGDIPHDGRSGLGFQLVEAFSSLGFIYHYVWVRETSLHLI